MQCPATPAARFRHESPTLKSRDSATLRRRTTVRTPLGRRGNLNDDGLSTASALSGDGLTPNKRFRHETPQAVSCSSPGSLGKVFENFEDSQPRNSVAALQFRDAAKRLRFSTLSVQSVAETQIGFDEAQLWVQADSLFSFPQSPPETPSQNNLPIQPLSPERLTDHDVTSVKRTSHYPRDEDYIRPNNFLPQRNQSPMVTSPMPRQRQRLPTDTRFRSTNHSTRMGFGGTRRYRNSQLQEAVNEGFIFTKEAQAPHSGRSEAEPAAIGHHERPIRSRSHDTQKSDTRPPGSEVQPPEPDIEPTEVVPHVTASNPSQVDARDLEPTAEASHSDAAREQSSDVPPSVRESLDSAVTDCLGDTRLQLKRWEVWTIRIVFSLFVFTINIALGLAYLGSHKHPYLLAVLVFMKSKDILSTLVDLSGLGFNYCHRKIWPPKKPGSKWILSLVCAYAETEEQIMKTVQSLVRGNTRPHKQAICIMLDGKPRNILPKLGVVKTRIQLPYRTWKGDRGELIINAGSVEGVPTILMEKVKNAGKKDSLILGHDLFDWPREDMPHSTRLLRQELWKVVLPSIIPQKDMTAFDFIFCTDADSTIHEEALQKLANAICEQPNIIAACGLLFAEFGPASTEYSVWHLFQQFQYTFGQYVRRQAESMWGRVTCLPGCITMIAVRPEMGPALSEYAKPVTGHNLFRHQVQYLGTDRRLTWSMMSQNKHLRTVFVPDALSETVTPSSLSHYLSQRRRWASNAYFNDFFYAFGPQQRLITRLFALIDLVRLTLVFYRVFNTAYFLHGLVTHFYVIKIIPTLVVTKTPALWYIVLVLCREPLLRKRMHKILLGMCINQVISPILSVIVFVNLLLNIGSSAWGKTGASTAGPAAGAVPEPPQTANSPNSWTPRRLAKSVKMAIRGATPMKTAKKPADTTPQQDDAQQDVRSSQSTSSAVEPVNGGATTDDSSTTTTEIATASGSNTSNILQADVSGVTSTPANRLRKNSMRTPMSLIRRTPYHRPPAPSRLEAVGETPTRGPSKSS